MPSLVFVLYDGIYNSVFAGQVLQPLLERSVKNPNQPIWLISFEKNKITNQQLQKIIPPKSNIQVRILKKIPFFGTYSLRFASGQLRQILNTIVHNYQLIARGPLAGWICMRALDTIKCSFLTIQARGLLAQEYAYAHQHNINYIKKLWHYIRAKQYASIEKTVYKASVIHHMPIIIEAVSNALKNYLIKTFDAKQNHITIATHDVPKKINDNEKKQYRLAIRSELKIPLNKHMYCYNGSAKPWQCPEKIIKFFKTKLTQNSHAFLLILSQDKMLFEQIIQQQNIDKKNYLILRVEHTKIYQYLAACDAGIIFRKPHIINWVSRPTKILEYQAAGLSIIHNNTIEWLNENIR